MLLRTLPTLLLQIVQSDSSGVVTRRRILSAFKSRLGANDPHHHRQRRATRNLFIGSHPGLDELHDIAEIFHSLHLPMDKEPKPVVICGPSGSGKSTLITRLFDEYSNEFGFSVSHTTRQPRPGEIAGKHYHYVRRDEMERMISDHEFIEYAEFSGNIYGTSKQAVKDVVSNGQICVLDIDCQGAKQIKNIPDIFPLYIFISPPSLDKLEARLRQRGTETEESVVKRLQAADEEIRYSREPNVFDKIIINDQLDIAYEQLRTYLHSEIAKVQAIHQKQPTINSKLLGSGDSTNTQ